MARLFITNWTIERLEYIGSHRLCLLTVPATMITVARRNSASVLPKHYLSGMSLSQAFDMLDKTEFATLLRRTLPQQQRIRSGDLGEIFTAEYINEQTNYRVPINRLRWKDNRNMPMLGDDVIGIRCASDGKSLRFLKAESKSRQSLNETTVNDARESLDQNDGLPSAHSLIFIANCLNSAGNNMLAAAILRAVGTLSIRHNQVNHLVFAFTGNAPRKYLKNGLDNYTGSVRQITVGLRIPSHQDFVSSVFEKALANNEPKAT